MLKIAVTRKHVFQNLIHFFIIFRQHLIIETVFIHTTCKKTNKRNTTSSSSHTSSENQKCEVCSALCGRVTVIKQSFSYFKNVKHLYTVNIKDSPINTVLFNSRKRYGDRWESDVIGLYFLSHFSHFHLKNKTKARSFQKQVLPLSNCSETPLDSYVEDWLKLALIQLWRHKNRTFLTELDQFIGRPTSSGYTSCLLIYLYRCLSI